MDSFNLNNNLSAGRDLFENIPNDLRPKWAGSILSCFRNHVKKIPPAITELLSLINEKQNWPNARGQFIKIRQFYLKHKSYKPEAYLLLAENVAKITYNATGLPAPFDHDSGWWIPNCALETAAYFQDESLEEQVRAAIFCFNDKKPEK
jgi:hypothetical protein